MQAGLVLLCIIKPILIGCEAIEPQLRTFLIFQHLQRNFRQKLATFSIPNLKK